VSENTRTLSDSHRVKRRHAGGGHRGPDRDLLEQAGLILLFMIIYGGFFMALAKFAGI
jgi:hypothetical protein